MKNPKRNIISLSVLIACIFSIYFPLTLSVAFGENWIVFHSFDRVPVNVGQDLIEIQGCCRNVSNTTRQSDKTFSPSQIIGHYVEKREFPLR